MKELKVTWPVALLTCVALVAAVIAQIVLYAFLFALLLACIPLLLGLFLVVKAEEWVCDATEWIRKWRRRRT